MRACAEHVACARADCGLARSADLIVRFGPTRPGSPNNLPINENPRIASRFGPR